MLILDPTTADSLVLDPQSTTWLVLSIETVGAAGSFRGCLNVSASLAGGVELAATMQGSHLVSPAVAGGVDVTAAIQGTFLVAPTMAGALEIGVMNCEGELSHGDLLLENTTDVRIVGLKVGGAAVNDATCTMTLRTEAGVIVVGADALALTYTGTAGEYLGRLPDTLALVESGEYRLKVRASKAGVAVGTWTADMVAKVRGANHCA